MSAKQVFLPLAWIVYACVGVVQILATVSGIQHATGLWWLVCWVIGIFLGGIPGLGTALGIYGAHMGWNWSLSAAFILFLGIPGFFFLMGGTVILLVAFAAKRRSRRTNTTLAGVQRIVNDYGAVQMSRKSTFADASELPYPKPVIKRAMIAAMSITQDAKTRELLKDSYVSLADWQEGIGPGPHPFETAIAIKDVRASAEAVCAASPSYMEINAKVIAEMEDLMAELKVLGL